MMLLTYYGEMPANVVKRLLRKCTPDTRNDINKLLKYPDNSAGSIMTVEYAELKENLTIKQAIESLKKEMEYYAGEYDIAVIGAGHAGCEAALAAARKGHKTLLDEFGLTQDEAARSVGRSRPAVANALRLLNLCPDVLSLVEKGSLSAGHARALVPISNPKTQLEAAEEIITKSLSVRKAEALAAKLVRSPVENKAAKPDSPSDEIDYLKEISVELTKCTGRKVTVSEGKGSGRIELEFYGADDRETLISQVRNLNK